MTFDGLPDIPISRFQLTFTNPPGLLGTTRDLCVPPVPVFHADFTGYNGASASVDAAGDRGRLRTRLRERQSGGKCKKAKAKKKHRQRAAESKKKHKKKLLQEEEAQEAPEVAPARAASPSQTAGLPQQRRSLR